MVVVHLDVVDPAKVGMPVADIAERSLKSPTTSASRNAGDGRAAENRDGKTILTAPPGHRTDGNGVSGKLGRRRSGVGQGAFGVEEDHEASGREQARSRFIGTLRCNIRRERPHQGSRNKDDRRRGPHEGATRPETTVQTLVYSPSNRLVALMSALTS